MAVASGRSMTEGPLFKNIVLYTIPIILTSILQLLFNAADLVVVGRFCGSISVAAVGATSSVTNLMVNLFIGFSVGAGVSVAQAIGAKRSDSVSRAVHTAVLISVLCGAVLTVIGVIFCKDFLVLMGTPDDVVDLSAVYMRIYFSGIIFTMLYNFCAAILRAVGNTKAPLVFLTIAGVVNVVLNVIFVTLFDMNVAGVALATIISQAIAAFLSLAALMHAEGPHRVMFSELRIHSAELREIFRIGLPAGLQSSLFGISNVIIQSSINSFGSVFLSGSSAASNIEGFVYVTIASFNQTAMNFIGQNYGAKKFDRVKSIMRICLISVAIVGAVAGSLTVLFGKTLLSVYITDSPEAIACGLIRLTYICLPYFICGLMDTTTGALRGMGSSVAPMVISVAGVCGFRLLWIFTVFAQPQFHTPQCLFFSYTISWSLTFIFELVLFICIYRKRRRAELA